MAHPGQPGEGRLRQLPGQPLEAGAGRVEGELARIPDLIALEQKLADIGLTRGDIANVVAGAMRRAG